MAAENQLREILHLLQHPHLPSFGATGRGAASSTGNASTDRETPVSAARGSSTPAAGDDQSTTQQAASTASAAACAYFAAADVLRVTGEAAEWHHSLTESLSENVPLPERPGTGQGHALTTLRALQQPQDDAAPFVAASGGGTGSGSLPSSGEVSLGVTLGGLRRRSPAVSSSSSTAPSAANAFDRQQVAAGGFGSGRGFADQARFSHIPGGFGSNSSRFPPQQREELCFGQQTAALEGDRRPHEAPYSPGGRMREDLPQTEQRHAFLNRIEPGTAAPGGGMGVMGTGELSRFQNDLLDSRTIGDFTEADLLAAVGGSRELHGEGPGGREALLGKSLEKGTKRTHKKKPSGMPSFLSPRVLSAYNFFFSAERTRILKSLSDADNDSVAPKENPKRKGFDSDAFDDDASQSKEDDSGKECRSARKRESVDASVEDEDESGDKAKKLKTESSDEKGKEGDDIGDLSDMMIRSPIPTVASHRKTRKKIGFKELAQLIGQRWKALSPEEREKYENSYRRIQQEKG